MSENSCNKTIIFLLWFRHKCPFFPNLCGHTLHKQEKQKKPNKNPILTSASTDTNESPSVICTDGPAQTAAWDLQLEGGSGIMVVAQDVGELLIYKIYSAARACHQSAELAIAQFGSGLEDRSNGLSTSKRPEPTVVPGPSSLTDCIKA